MTKYRKLNLSDRIIAMSMGKIVAVYSVTKIIDEEALATSPSGRTVSVKRGVSANGAIVRISDGLPYEADYFIETTGLKRRIDNEEVIGEMSSVLADAVSRVQTISLTYPPSDIKKACEDLKETLRKIYDEFEI